MHPPTTITAPSTQLDDAKSEPTSVWLFFQRSSIATWVASSVASPSNVPHRPLVFRTSVLSRSALTRTAPPTKNVTVAPAVGHRITTELPVRLMVLPWLSSHGSDGSGWPLKSPACDRESSTTFEVPASRTATAVVEVTLPWVFDLEPGEVDGLGRHPMLALALPAEPRPVEGQAVRVATRRAVEPGQRRLGGGSGEVVTVAIRVGGAAAVIVHHSVNAVERHPTVGARVFVHRKA